MNKDVYGILGDLTAEILLEIIAECMDDYLYVIDLQNNKMEISQSALDRFMISETHVRNVKQEIMSVVYKEDRTMFAKHMQAVMDGKKLVFNYPILEKIVDRFKKSVANDAKRQEAVISYDIDEYDERFLRHLALGYTKEMIANLKGMPFGVKSLEKRQNDLIGRLFPNGERVGVNATRLAVRALELRIIDLDNLEPDEE